MNIATDFTWTSYFFFNKNITGTQSTIISVELHNQTEPGFKCLGHVEVYSTHHQTVELS